MASLSRLSSEAMHRQAFEFVAAAVERLGPFDTVVEIGAQDINGSVRPLFAGADYVGLDVTAGPGVDVVFDPAEGWTPPEPVAAVVCCEVLEHVEAWPTVLELAFRCLRPGGVLILTCAGPGRRPHSGITGRRKLEPGEHYANVSPDALSFELGAADWERAEVDYVPSDTRAVAWR